MKIVKIAIIIGISLGAISSQAQTINTNWKQELIKSMSEYLNCSKSEDEKSLECVKYSGGSLETVYKVNDFFLPSKGRHMTNSEIAAFLMESKKWSLLGQGFEQKALKEASERANAKKAVVAVYLNSEGIGHMAVILPGELARSGSWGLEVPNSASFFAGQPEKSYVEKGLSYAFERSALKHVKLYAREY